MKTTKSNTQQLINSAGATNRPIWLHQQTTAPAQPGLYLPPSTHLFAEAPPYGPDGNFFPFYLTEQQKSSSRAKTVIESMVLWPGISGALLDAKQRPHRLLPGGLSQREVAELMGLSERGVRKIEKRALAKLRNHPLLRKFWKEYLTGELEEQTGADLTPAEIQALFDLACTPAERAVLQKVIQIILPPYNKQTVN